MGAGLCCKVLVYGAQGPGSILGTTKLGMMGHIRTPGLGRRGQADQVEAGRSEVQSHSWLRMGFEASQGHRRACYITR